MLFRSVDGGVYKVGVLADGTAIVQDRLETGYFPSSATIKLWTFKSGVTFDDGTVVRYLGLKDLDVGIHLPDVHGDQYDWSAMP